jgi:acyl carrier protein
LEFLGRIDHQVKVRGFRIELGEIEAVLRQQAGVADAVVVTQPAPDGSQQLLAYVVADRGGVKDGTKLRGKLRSRLPEYMIPSAFLPLDRIPLTANGKVDRKALPEPAGALIAQRPYVPPRTPIEQAVAGIWARTLGVERVGAHDDFHELGGHSLLATQLISRIRESFGVELPIADLFESPTVAGLAGRIEDAAWGGMGSGVPPLELVPRKDPLPLSFAQQRLWFLDQLVPGSAFYNVPAAVWLEGQVDATVLEHSLLEIMRRHEVLRTTFQAAGGRPTQVINPDPALAFEQRDLTPISKEGREAEALRTAKEEVQQPFDLERGPLLRTLLLKLSETRYLLVLTLHHIVTDGWSMGVLVRELGLAYDAFSAGKPSPLPPLSIQYGDFAQWQRGWLQGDVVAGQLQFWRQKLAGSAMLQLPTDRARPPVQTWHGATEEFCYSADLLKGLTALGRRERA